MFSRRAEGMTLWPLFWEEDGGEPREWVAARRQFHADLGEVGVSVVAVRSSSRPYRLGQFPSSTLRQDGRWSSNPTQHNACGLVRRRRLVVAVRVCFGLLAP